LNRGGICWRFVEQGRLPGCLGVVACVGHSLSTHNLDYSFTPSELVEGLGGEQQGFDKLSPNGVET
jgi:hypothetical protein